VRSKMARGAWKRRTGWAEPMSALGGRACVLEGPRNPMRVSRNGRKAVEAATWTLKTLEDRVEREPTPSSGFVSPKRGKPRFGLF